MQFATARLSGGRWNSSAVPSTAGDTGTTVESYVTAVFEALAVFRFLSYALGASLVFFLNLGDQPPFRLALLLGIVGLYNIARVAFRFTPAAYGPFVIWLILGSDVSLSVTLVFLTNGLDSAFLVYSLAPVLTTSLLMDARSAIAAATISALSVSGAYVVAGLGIGEFPWILHGNYLVFALLYLAVCLLIAYLPFLANLNWQARVRSESMSAERRRLRREVHDNVAQTLAFLSLKVRRAEEKASTTSGATTSRDVMDIRSMVERAYLAVRDYLDETLDRDAGEPLGTSLAVASGQWSRDTGLPVQMNLARGDYISSPLVKRQLLQIAREALANVAKHSNSSQVWVELDYSPDEVRLRIRDNGRGFGPSQPRGHGLDIMSERAAVVGAKLAVDSSPGKGTEVVVIYPLRMQENHQ